MSLSTILAFYDRQLPTLQSLCLLFVRVTMGWGFFLTGRGKLLDLDRTTQFFESLHLPLPQAQAILAGSTELIGGLLLVLGLGTRFAAVPLIVTMIVAYLTAHRDEAFKSLSNFTDQDPFPFLMAALVLLAFGAGRFALDPWAKGQLDKIRRPA